MTTLALNTPVVVHVARAGLLRRYVAANFRFFLLLLILLIGLFELFRLGLILYVRTPADASWAELRTAFLTGFRFDLSTACYLLIPVMVLCYVPWTAPWRSRRTRSVFLWALTVIVSLLALVLIAEFQFYGELQTRYNQLAIRYLKHAETVGGMAWHNYPVIRILLGWLVVAAVIHLALRLAMRFAYGRADAQAPTKQNRPALLVELAGGLLLAAGIALGARGGVQPEPIRWGDAFKHDNEFVCMMSQNGLWSLGMAARDSLNRSRESGPWSTQLSMEEARRLSRELIVAPGEKLLDAPGRTVLRTGGDHRSSPVLAGKDGKPLNVVVVMMESYSARFCGATGAPRSFTPALDALAKDGILFSQCFSAGSHTHQGIFATQLGFPNLPGYETLMESAISNQQFCSLAAILEPRGYQTLFLYNGNFAWDNMRGFFNKQGVNKFVGGEEMLTEAKYRDKVWGVSDGDLFDRCNREFEAASKLGPFFAAVMTLSNHVPFDVPPVPGAAPVTDMGDLNRRLEAMRYADYCVGKFIEDAKKLSYFQNTLFVFIGDHGFAVRPVLTDVNLLYHHVPLLFYSAALPADQRGRVDRRAAGQNHVVPSVLGLIGAKDAPHASWSRSLFADDATPSFTVFKMSGGGRAVAMARGDELLVLNNAKAEPQLLRYTLWPPAVTPATDPDAPARKRTMARELKAYVQAALADLSEHNAGPKE